MENAAEKVGLWEGLLRSHQKSLKALFSPKSANADQNDDVRSIPHLSPLANSVVSRCSRILKIPTEELEAQFGTAIPEDTKELLTYSRNFLEFCSYQALHMLTKRPDYLSDKEFRRLTFDMMLAWEVPSVENKRLEKEAESCSNEEVGDEAAWSLFYSTSTKMAVQ